MRLPPDIFAVSKNNSFYRYILQIDIRSGNVV